MPRVNLSISEDLYKQLQKDADKRNITVNNLILDMIEDKYNPSIRYDYTLALNNMISESKKTQGEYTLSDLPTFKNVEQILIENHVSESPASVRARLGKMYNEAVKKGSIKGIERAVVNRNGVEELKFLCRAAVYYNKLNKPRKEGKE
ncbi:hypothetical protein [Butyrivibrio sp. M55]|uniref:hypothetical protein n=1 Tax=Butyrivibrio sp. M55 TaxID=1855323 RepID=UPI0008E5BF86|nr:hypothetical protein [Butyrivibrio sp. M55]SFU87605.1 hypothetical protein SAMN05216540_11612 [Butyrivibrio sp. M55]